MHLFYTLALFAHLLGVLSLFVGMGLQWAILLRLRRAQTIAQVREWSGLIGGVGKLGPISGALILIAGLYMTLTTWSLTTPWIAVSLAAMLLMVALGIGVTAKRLRVIQRAAAAEASSDTVPAQLRRQIHDPRLWLATQLAGSIALGVVFLMTTKPGLGGSLVVVSVVLIVGGVVARLSAHGLGKLPVAPVSVKEAGAR